MASPTESVKKLFESFLDDSQIKIDPSDLCAYGTDNTEVFKPNPLLIVLPKTTEEVQEIVKTCYDNNIAMVPSGGRTGMAAGAIAAHGEVVISMEKMNRVLSIDAISSSMEVEAGVVLEDAQLAAKEASLYLPIDFGAKGSAEIGGCISTNAGGCKVFKYGMTRHHVLGIEVVTPSGDILNLNTKLYKNNAGYDLKQLFIGAEGTLGIITKATLKLAPKPKHLVLGYFGVQEFSHILEILKIIKSKSLDITAFEFLPHDVLESTLAYIPKLKNPLATKHPFYILVEIDASDDGTEFRSVVENLFEQNLIADGTFAENDSQFKALWTIRESAPDGIRAQGFMHRNDISVPISALSEFLPKLLRMFETDYRGLTVYYFGHISDGNLHVDILNKGKYSQHEFEAMIPTLDRKMFELVASFNGSISAEHGIGLLKRDLLHIQRTPLELELMRKIKAIFDPKQLMNPGKII